MALTNIETNIILDLYDHDLTPTKIKAIQLDSNTRYVSAVIRGRGGIYDVGQNTSITLTVIRPDKVGVQITGEPVAHTETTPDEQVITTYGAYAELSQAALAKNGTLRAQFMLTSGDQILRTEIFSINCGEALDASTDTWADEYQGHNLDEMAEQIEDLSSDVSEIQEDLGNVKSGLSELPKTATPEDGDADLYVCDKDGNVLAKFEDGHIKTKNFDSSDIDATVTPAVETFSTSGDYVVGTALTLTVEQAFRKGDEIYFHLSDGLSYAAFGQRATYYEGEKIVYSNRKGSNGYVRHIVTADCNSVGVLIGGSEYSSTRTITLYVYRKNGEVAPKVITVKTDGTGMFTRLKDAVESITDANHVSNPYVIEVYEGTYNTLDGYTTEEINSADIGGGYSQSSMVGVKLTDGISLRGVGRCDNIILTAELSNSFSSAVRGNISTLNLQGEGNLENVTIIGKNIRYCVHDDFYSPVNSHDKRVLRNLKFKGEYLAYYPFFTTYGAGMSAPRDYLIENCDFGFDLGIHSNGGYAFGCTIEVNNCSGARFRIGDSATAESDAINRVIVKNCNFQMLNINHGTSGLTNHMMVEGVGNEYSMVKDATLSLYRLGMIDLAPTGLTTGKMVKRTATGLTFEATADKAVAHGIVIGSDSDFSYVQKCGYIASTMLSLSDLALGDYVTVDSTGTVVTGGTSENAIGVVTTVIDSVAFIKLMVGGAI